MTDMKNHFLAVLLVTVAALWYTLPVQAYPTSGNPLANFNLGLGVGPLYGEGGANVEYHVSRNFSLSCGFSLHDGSNWFFGSHVYMKPDSR